ncbi:MAG TPA: hypothetical protein VGL98_03585, partial [Gammaproteobacteria bacterium]
MSSYAFGGSAGGPCHDDKLTGEHHHNYPSPGLLGLEFARPIPAHAQTVGALEAVESVRAHGRAARLDRRVADLVLDHGNAPDAEPWLVPEYRVTKKGKSKPTGRLVPGAVRTASAVKLAELAVEHGFDVRTIEQSDRCIVTG